MQPTPAPGSSIDAPVAGLPAVDDLVVVRVGGHAYGIPVRAVVEVTRMVALSPLPDAPAWVAGVLDLRGVPVPVVDLALRLGRLSQTPVLERRIVVTGDPAAPVGVIVDGVTDVGPAGPPPVPGGSGGGGPASPLVRRAVRVGADLVMVLDEAALWTGQGA